MMVKRYKWLGDLIYADGNYAYPDDPVSLVDSADYDELAAMFASCREIGKQQAEALAAMDRRVKELEAAATSAKPAAER